MGLAACTAGSMAAQQTLSEATDSIKNILAEAKKGNAKAQNEVGTWYYTGKHVKQDYNEAAQWWARAAQQNNAKAIGNLGLCYQKGNGVEADSVRALNLYGRSVEKGNDDLLQQRIKLADNGSLFDCIFVANCYNHGKGVKRDKTKAIEYFTKAAKANSADGQRELALIYLNSKEPEKAVEWFKRGANNNDLSSIFYYGKLLSEGKGIKQDPQQGANYLLKAAEAGFPMGQYEIAQSYFNGNGVVKNTDQAIAWLTKAANNGVGKAQYQLATCYVNGEGVPVDFDQATGWFAAVLSKSHEKTFRKLFEPGENSWAGTPYHEYLKGLKYYSDKDFDNAMKRFKAVEKAKQKEGKTMQGVILANKEYAKHDLKKGVKSLSEAAKTIPMAMYLLGGMYEAGRGVDKNMEQALTYLTQAADAGYAPALCYLGDMYYEGRGVAQDYAKAIECYNKAMAQLTPSAAKRLASCYENGYGGLEPDKKAAEAILKKQNTTTAEILKLIPMD